MAVVFDIQRCSLHDGPGIRTTVFLKGCNLRCGWCHNPESYRRAPELGWQESLCTACGRCVPACPNGAHSVADGRHSLDRSLCTACGRCVDYCPNDALRLYGREMTAEEVVAEAMKDERFYRESGGGVTFSGGEAALQGDFLTEALTLCRARGLHTALETNLCLPWATLEGLLPLTDLFLCDFKHHDSAAHRLHCGQGNEEVLANLRRLHKAGAALWLRCPIIPGVNDGHEHFAAIAALSRELRPQKVELMPYHNTARGKWRALGLANTFEGLPTATQEQKAHWQGELEELLK